MCCNSSRGKHYFLPVQKCHAMWHQLSCLLCCLHLVAYWLGSDRWSTHSPKGLPPKIVWRVPRHCELHCDECIRRPTTWSPVDWIWSRQSRTFGFRRVEERLPATATTKTSWLWQRLQSSSWSCQCPCCGHCGSWRVSSGCWWQL